jgi:hypothetical protein
MLPHWQDRIRMTEYMALTQSTSLVIFSCFGSLLVSYQAVPIWMVEVVRNAEGPGGHPTTAADL